MSLPLSITDPAESRIIHMTNVHYDVRRKHLDEFFAGYVIEDTFHTKNTATRRPDVVYILFATAADRNRELQREGQHFLDRKVRMQPAIDGGNYRWKHTEKFRHERRLIVTVNDEKTAFVKTPPSKKKQPPTPDTEAGSANQPPDVASTEAFPPLGGGQEQKVHCKATGKDVVDLNREAQTATELPRDIPMERAAYVPEDFLNWNLQGHDANDRSRNVITPGDWYGFEAKQYEKIEREQKEHGTNVGKIFAQSFQAEGRDDIEAKLS